MQSSGFSNPPQHQGTVSMPQNQHGSNRRGGSMVAKILIVVFALILIATGFAWLKNQSWAGFARGANSPNPGLHQAVFLTNGQVYFGKITKATRDFLVLEDIYYLQVTQPLQQLSHEELAQLSPEQQEAFLAEQNQIRQQLAEAGQPEDEPIMNLIKMGSEIHGPEDKMVIPIHNVLFWEDIRDDGTVGQAIAEFKRQQN